MRPSTEIDTLRNYSTPRAAEGPEGQKCCPIDWPTPNGSGLTRNEIFAFDLATIPQSCWKICETGRTSNWMAIRWPFRC